MECTHTNTHTQGSDAISPSHQVARGDNKYITSHIKGNKYKMHGDCLKIHDIVLSYIYAG